MGIELPAELAGIAAKAGVSWPKADEDAMRSSATAWREAGDKIKALGTSSDGVATRALDGLTGGTGDAARGRWAKVVAPDGDFQRAARGCHAAADRLDHAARQVGAAKVEIVRELVALAKNNDAATASASAGNPNALLGLDTLTKGAAANVANLTNLLSSAIRLDSGVDMSQGSPPVNTSPGAHGPGGGGGGGLLSPVTDVVGGVVAPVASVVAPVVEPVAAVVAPVTEAVAPVVGAVTAPVAPVVGAVTAPVAPVAGAVTEAVAPVLDAAAPVTAPAAAVVQPVVDAVPGAHQAVGPVLDGRGDGDGPRGDGPRGDGPGDGHGRGEGQGRGEGRGLPGLVADTGHAVAPAAHHAADAIPSVQGTLGPIAEGTTRASAAVLEQPLVRGDVPGQAAAAPQPPAAPAAPAGPAAGPMAGAPAAGPTGAPVGGAAGGAAPAVASQVGAAVGQQAGAQPGQAAQGQQAQQAAKAAEAKAGEAKAGEAKPGAPASSAAKTGLPGAAATAGGQAGGALPGQTTSQVQAPAQGQGGQAPGQAQPGQQGQVSGKEGLAKDAHKDPWKDALHRDAEAGDFGTDGSASAPQKLGDTIATPAVPLAGVDLGPAAADLGGARSSALTDRLEGQQNQALADAGLAGDVLRHTYTAAAAGSWFMAIFLSAGQAPRRAPKPARQLPPPPQEQEQERVVPRFAPGDHPRAHLVGTSAPQPAAPSEGLRRDHPVVQELLKDHDPLAGMHERDWDSLFLNEDGTPRWPVEREGGYEDSQPEVLKAGAEIDRFGTPEGRVLSTAGTPFRERSLPPQAADEGYRRYRVCKDLPVHRTISAPWFGQPGGASRYRTTHPVADLVALGYLTEITA
ncbi:TNT domain-containing protein [Lentzea sp. DG1S-22]|uniref:TNT domain-containing protein n=1 Tax=Lentzea sp. DG1S-22 TaxID=3108822 RepID=UPI002E79FAEB|nr:TNT domain-containing protein [Lentzea sp. DG1S-22]WVH79691.1 TNT domain-containing protein [Lentzea sp. DG1S-22]